MKLFLKPGACSMATHILFNELGIDYETETVDTSAGTTATGEDFLKINPRGYVPALKLDDGQIITENPAILEYVGDLRPGAFTPVHGTMDRVRLSEMLSFLGSELHKAFSPLFAGLEGEARTEALAKLNVQFKRLDNILSDARPYLLGETYTAADMYAFVVLGWTDFLDISLAGYTHIEAFRARIAERPAVQETLKQESLIA